MINYNIIDIGIYIIVHYNFINYNTNHKFKITMINSLWESLTRYQQLSKWQLVNY